tara:strand:- start:349 stop:1224 length:876 start_codon:yes stop_codon:yes gene_type:complete
MTIKYKKSEWTEVDKGIKFNKIENRNINAVLDALKESDSSHYGWRGDKTEEEIQELKQESLDSRLAKIPEEHIESTIVLLTAHVNHLLTYKEKNGGYSWSQIEWRIADKPFIQYSLQARYTELKRNSRPISRVLKRWTARVEKHWENRNNAKDNNEKKRQESLIYALCNRVTRCKDSEWNILTEDKVRKKLRSTMLKMTTGQTNSSHGDFSFGMHYSTYYVNEDLTLREFDRDSLKEDYKKECYYDTLDDYFRGQADLYIKQLVAYQRKYYKASEAWLKVMKPAYDKIMEV